MNSQNYESLTDPHLNAYFNNKRIRRHLIKAGLINRHGDILPPSSYEVVLARQTKRREAKDKLSHMIANYVVEDEQKRQVFLRNQFEFAIKRARVQKIRKSRHPQQSMLTSLVHVTKRSRSRNARTPSPTGRKHSSVRAKSAGRPPINAKNQLVRRPTTAKHTSNNEYCEVTMIYYGPQTMIDYKKKWFQPNGDEIMIMQQHCGGENLIVFKGFVKPNEIFKFESRRHPEYPFAVALYINGLIDSRISVCCEYKHKHNVRLGSKYGLFGIYNVQKSQPCRSCRFEKRIKDVLPTPSNIINPSSYRKSIVPSVLSTNEFCSAVLLRTPSPFSDKEEEPSEQKFNRISTIAEPTLSPRTRSSVSSQNEKKIEELQRDESINDNSNLIFDTKPNTPDRQSIDRTKDESRKSSRVSSSTSKKSVPDSSVILLKNEDPDGSLKLSSIKRNSDEKATTSSRKSTSLSISSSGTETDESSFETLLEKVHTEKQTSRSSSSSSTKSGSSIESKNNDERLEKDKVRTSSTSSSASESVDRPLSFDDYSEKQRHSSTSSSSTSEIGQHSIKNELESHHSSISSADKKQPTDTYDQNLLETDTTSSNDDIKSESSAKQKGHNEDKQTQSDKNPVRQYRSMENIIVAWLGATVDNTDDDTINSKAQLRQIARTIRTFSDPEKCIQWIKEIKSEKIFLIVSGDLSENILEQVDYYAQIAVIYIFCPQNSKYEYLIDKYKKIKGVYTDISIICEHLKIDSKQWDNDLNTFQTTSSIDMKQLNSEQLQFIQNQLFKQYLLDINYDKDAIDDLVEYCENLYAENTKELELIKQFENEYKSNDALHWYTKDCFAYHMLNRAIRMKDITILFQMGFFIRDINQQLEEDYLTTKQRSRLTVYRGQG
ncbi:unnamed protein product [Rotaria sp. Silwood1]|nr:unnamed protein product [Rotaria sp. Silwood1]